MFYKTGLTAVLLGASAANAHMIMAKPAPYGAATLNNSPLLADGSDFPCKQRSGVYDAPDEETTAKIGQSMPLSFTGTAVHGGGSCQVSLTKDLKPTKDSEWMVIKSIEGGCPANVDGNLPEGGSSPESSLSYKIPEGIEEGKYTLAWTWFNRVGNREMYMNCAPITVEGGSSSKRDVQEKRDVEKRSTNFPSMFVANVNGCTTQESVDIRFPNPGEYVDRVGSAGNLASEGSDACSGTPSFGGAGTKKGSSSSGGSSGGSSDSGSAPEPTKPSGGATEAPAPGVFAPTDSATSSPTAPAEPAEPTEPAQPEPSATTPPAEGSSEGSLTGACDEEGLWNCVDGSSFQRCASGQWSEVQPMAAGTQCEAGQTQNLSVTALKPRMLSAMRHARRAHGGHHA